MLNTVILRGTVSSGMLRRVALVITDVSEEFRTTIIRVTRVGELAQHALVASYSYSCS
jgi:hypothetical protein